MAGPAAAVNEHRSDRSLEGIIDIEALEAVAIGQFHGSLLGQRGLRIALNNVRRLQGTLHVAPATVNGPRTGTPLGQMHRLDHPLVHFDFSAVL